MAIEVTVTPAAEKAFGELHSERGADYIRVWAGEACGCGRIGYQMAVEDHADQQDLVMPAGVVKLLISPDSAPHLDGSTIDYFDDVMQAGFTINNPNAPAGCGCGGGGHH
jgi:iron-sulfur cluster assembly accessory protein